MEDLTGLGPYPATLSGPCRRTAKRSGGAPSNHRDPNPAKSSPAHAAEGTAKGDNPARHPVVAETVKGWRNQAPASKQASALTAEALARIRPENPGDGDRVFRLSIRQMANRIKDAVAAAGFDGQVRVLRRETPSDPQSELRQKTHA